MGGTPSKDTKYINAITSLDLLLDAPPYGFLFISVLIDPEHNIKENWSENRKKWFSEEKQLILSLLSSVLVSSISGDSLIFHLCIPFSRNNLKVLRNSLHVDFEFNNYFTGFKGHVKLDDLPKSFMRVSKTSSTIFFIGKETITLEFYYTIAGTPLFDDLKYFAVVDIPLEEQLILLAKIFEYERKR